MLLKALVQLFAEKFLTNKKSWLYQNSIALKNDPITVFSGSSGISVRLKNGESDKNYLQWPQLILPCAKGDSWQVNISINTGQTEGTTVRFIPSIGG